MQDFEKVIERVNDLISHGSIGADLTIPVKAKHLAKILSETEILNTIKNYKMSCFYKIKHKNYSFLDKNNIFR